MPAVIGVVFQADVRPVVQVCVSVLVSTKISLGDITIELQLMSPCMCPASVDMQSKSIADGLATESSVPTIARKLVAGDLVLVEISSDPIPQPSVINTTIQRWRGGFGFGQNSEVVLFFF